MTDFARLLAIMAWSFAFMALINEPPNKHMEAAAMCAAASWLAWLTSTRR